MMQHSRITSMGGALLIKVRKQAAQNMIQYLNNAALLYDIMIHKLAFK